MSNMINIVINGEIIGVQQGRLKDVVREAVKQGKDVYLDQDPENVGKVLSKADLGIFKLLQEEVSNELLSKD